MSAADRRFLAIPNVVFPICPINIVIAGAMGFFLVAAAILTALPVWWHWFSKHST